MSLARYLFQGTYSTVAQSPHDPAIFPPNRPPCEEAPWDRYLQSSQGSGVFLHSHNPHEVFDSFEILGVSSEQGEVLCKRTTSNQEVGNTASW